MAVIGLSASAQEKRDVKQAIKNAEKATLIQTKEMVSSLKLNDNVVDKVQAILLEKNNLLAQYPDLSEQRKAIIIENTLNRLKEVLSESEIKQLMENTELYSKIKSTDGY